MLTFFTKLIGTEAKDTSPSPFGRWINGKLIAAEKGKLTVDVLLRDEFANPAGIVHGGVLGGIIDEVIGMTTFTLGREGFFVAVNLNLDFLRPGKIGETVRVEAEVIREGKTMVHAECKIYNNEGKLMAKATSNLALTQR
jgi:acyl-coenzyme A thioesterase 13